MSCLLLSMRLAVALVFGIAAVAKLRDGTGVRATLQQLRVPRRAAAASAVCLPAAELAVAVSLVPATTARAGAAAATVLLALFTGVFAAAVARGERPVCACFGRVSAPVGAWTFARNAAIAATAGAVVAIGPGMSLVAVRVDAVWIPFAALAAGVLLLGAVVWQLVRQNGRLVHRLRALEVRESSSLVIGAPAPPVETAQGALGELVREGFPVALVFSQDGCLACAELGARVERLRVRATSLRIATVSNDATAVRDYGVEIVPSALLIGADGRIASGLAAGAQAVERFLTGVATPNPAELTVASA